MQLRTRSLKRFAAAALVIAAVPALFAQGRGGGRGQSGGDASGAAAAQIFQVQRVTPVVKNVEEQGKALWSANCITCHGTQARGSDRAPNLVRSEVANYDHSAQVVGSVLGPFLKKGHPTDS